MKDSALLRRMLLQIEARPDGLDLPQIAAAVGLPIADTERAVRLLVRAGRLKRRHEGPGHLRYACAAPHTRQASAAAPRPAPAVAAHTLTARVLEVLSRQRAALRAAEVVLLAGLPDDGRSASRVSATLCMLARRGRLRRVPAPDGQVRYALPGMSHAAAAPLRPRDLIDAGFRPAIPREPAAPLFLKEWMPTHDAERPSAATVCQRLRRGWPPELAATLPPLRRRAA